MTAAPVVHQFEVDPEDHCETPGAAYDDVAPALVWLASSLGKASPRQLKIYDPYYCAGAVVRHLTARGFPDVYNVNEDFYEVVDGKRPPPSYDILVTNPPYSGDHVEKLLKFCVASGKPWFVLVPNFVYTNPYYSRVLANKETGSILDGGVNLNGAAPVKPFYVVPQVRYEYVVPRGVRAGHAGEVKTAPFLSFWFCDLQSRTAAFIRQWRTEEAATAPSTLLGAAPPRPLMVGHLSQLPHHMRAKYDPSRRRLRPKQREANARRKRARDAEEDAAFRNARALEPCRFGASCTRPGCWFSH